MITADGTDKIGVIPQKPKNFLGQHVSLTANLQPV